MIKLRIAVLAGSVLTLATTAAAAQGRVSQVPPGMLPGPGLCRVWIDGFPPGQQPPVTDCATARANVRGNGRVIYGSASNGRISSDPRLDPRSPRYDPDYAARVRNDYDRDRVSRLGTEERIRYEARLREEERIRNEAIRREARLREDRIRNERLQEEARDRDRQRQRIDSRTLSDQRRYDELEQARRRQQKEAEKAERKRQKERRRDDHDRDDHHS
ncbi:MAG: hypothetical protein ABJE10_06125 [bacterium]